MAVEGMMPSEMRELRMEENWARLGKVVVDEGDSVVEDWEKAVVASVARLMRIYFMSFGMDIESIPSK